MKNNTNDDLEFKDIALFILFAFIVSIFIGFLFGKINRKPFTIDDAMQRVHYVTKVGNGVSFVHLCNNIVTHEYVLDSKKILRKDHVLKAPSDAYSPIIKHKEFLLALVGGSSGGLTLKVVKEIFDKQKHLKNKLFHNALTLIGIISGYSIGYYLGETSFKSCDSAQVFSKLSEPDFWEYAARLYLLGQFVETFELTKNTEKAYKSIDNISTLPSFSNKYYYDVLFDCELPLLAEMDSLVEKIEDVSSQLISNDFKTFDRLKSTYLRILALPQYPSFKQKMRESTTVSEIQEACKQLNSDLK